MSYYPDLSPYSHMSSGKDPHILNVGWLDEHHPYPQAELPQVFAERLWDFCRKPAIQTRGIHRCEFCHEPKASVESRDDLELTLGSAEIRVFGRGQTIYAAPTLIYHYVVRHRYCPPDEFVQAVMDSPLPGSPEYEMLARCSAWLEHAQQWWKTQELMAIVNGAVGDEKYRCGTHVCPECGGSLSVHVGPYMRRGFQNMGVHIKCCDCDLDLMLDYKKPA